MILKLSQRARLFIWLLLLLIPTISASQITEHWVLDRDISLIFDQGTPRILERTLVSEQFVFNHRSVVTLIDADEGLIFFTDGINIYDKDGSIISRDELSGSQGPLSTLIIQNPDVSSQYFVIVISRWISQGNRIHFSVVDIDDMDSSIIVGSENITVNNSANLNYVVGAYNPCNDSNWILSVDVNDGLLYAFPIYSEGIGEPVVSNLTQSIPLDRFPNFGGIAYNIERQMISVFHRGRSDLELLKFLSDGSAFTVASLSIEESNRYPHTAVFSPDGNEIIVGELVDESDQETNSWNIYRYDLTQLGLMIPKNLIGQTELIGFRSNLRVGPDGNYYFVNNRRDNTSSAVASVGRIDINNNYGIDTRFLPIDTDTSNLIETWGTIQNVVIAEQKPISIPDLISQNIISHCFDQSSLLLSANDFDQLLWSTGDTTSTISVDESGLYTIEADLQGCTVRDTVVVSDSDDCSIPFADCNTYIPNAIAPQSTMSNDSFRPVSNCELQDYRLEIYDRWGGRIYESVSPEQSWSGEEVDSGVYSYALRYTYVGDNQVTYHSGTVTVIR